MKKKVSKLLYWTPRVIGILFAVFISIFALDVFAEEYTFWTTVCALFIHLVPTYLIIGALLIAWKWEKIGGCLFLGLAGLYFIMILDNLMRGQTNVLWGFLLIGGPVILMGALFILNEVDLKKMAKKGRTAIKKWPYWTPRIFAILLTAFVVLSTLNVFFSGYGFWQTIGLLLFYLIPAYFMILATLLAWRWEIAGGLLFIGVGVLYKILELVQTERTYVTTCAGDTCSATIIPGVLVIIGILFILSKIDLKTVIKKWKN